MIASLERPVVPAPSPQQVLADFGPIYAANGFIGLVFAATGPVAIILSVGTSGGLSPAELASWIFGVFFINGLITVGMSWRYHQPLGFFWTIPGTVIWRSLGDGWDRNGSGGGSGRPCRTASFAKQEAARGAGIAGGDGVGRSQRQPEGTGRRRAARGRALGQALSMDQPAARQRAHRCRSRDGALRARGSGTRLRRLSNPRGDHRPEQGQRRPSHGDGVAARGRACPAFGLVHEEDPRRHRLSRAARRFDDGRRPAARGGAPHADGRSVLWLARFDRLVPR